MVTTDLGACEWFVWDLRRSNLIDRGQLDQVIGEFLNKNPGAEPPALAEFLVGQGILTDFQAERLLQGKTQGFVLGPFTLMDALGSGSMGTVYKAQSKTDNQLVRRQGAAAAQHVERPHRPPQGARSSSSASTPPSCPFVDVGTAGGMHYLAWPLVEGETLDKIVAEARASSAPEQAAQLRHADGRGARPVPPAGPVPRPAQAVEPDDRRRTARCASSTSASAACWPRPRANRWWTPCPRPTRSTAAWTAPAPRASWTRRT